MMTIDSVTTWQISIDVPIHSLDFMQNALEPVVNALSVKINTEDCLIRAYTQKRPEHEKILSAVARAAAEANIQTPYVEIIYPGLDFHIARKLELHGTTLTLVLANSLVGFFGDFNSSHLEVFENEKELFVEIGYFPLRLKRKKIIYNIPIWALFL